MDPYVIFHAGVSQIRSKVADNAGQSARFTDELTLKIEGTDVLVIGCYDDNPLSDDLVGETGAAILQLMKNCQNETWTSFRQDIHRHGEKSGYIQLEYIFLRDMT